MGLEGIVAVVLSLLVIVMLFTLVVWINLDSIINFISNSKNNLTKTKWELEADERKELPTLDYQEAISFYDLGVVQKCIKYNMLMIDYDTIFEIKGERFTFPTFKDWKKFCKHMNYCETNQEQIKQEAEERATKRTQRAAQRDFIVHLQKVVNEEYKMIIDGCKKEVSNDK